MWTGVAKKGWSTEGIEFFDNCVDREINDRREYERMMHDKQSKDRVDEYHYDSRCNMNQKCVVYASEIIEL